jgi:hypothetical protein
MTTPSTRPSLQDLLNGLSTNIQVLVSQTVTLARLEASAAASQLGWSAAGLLACLLVALAGVGVLVAALVLILIALGLPAWAASAVVGLVLTAGGALGARFCVSAMRQTELSLKETRNSLRETLAWLKLQTWT